MGASLSPYGGSCADEKMFASIKRHHLLQILWKLWETLLRKKSAKVLVMYLAGKIENIEAKKIKVPGRPGAPST